MTREESIETTQKQYDGVTERQFYNAAEKLFTLADEKDTSFSYPGEHDMIVQRRWMLYAVLAYSQGTYIWRISTQPHEGGIRAKAYVSGNSGTVTGSITSSGAATTQASPTMANMFNTPAIYELFWARMDYLLGKNTEWPTCQDWNNQIKQGKTYGSDDALCLAANTDDRLPEGAPQSKEEG